MRQAMFVRMMSLGLLLVSSVVLLPSPGSGHPEESALVRVQKRKEIKIGWAPYPPYHSLDPKTKQHVGAAVDVGEELGKFMGVKVTWVEDSWATLIAGLQSAKFDVVIPMDRTKERQMVAGYSNWLARSAQVLMTNKKDATKYKHFQDADKPGIRISATLGSASDVIATATYSKAEIVRVPTTPEALLQLVAGRVDAFVITIETATRAMKEHDHLRIADGVMISRTNGMVTRPDDQVMINFLNFFIDEKRSDGTLHRIWEKHGLSTYLVEPEWRQPK